MAGAGEQGPARRSEVHPGDKRLIPTAGAASGTSRGGRSGHSGALTGGNGEEKGRMRKDSPSRGNSPARTRSGTAWR